MSQTPQLHEKPGVKTTEFWLSFVAVIVGAVMASGLLPDSGPWKEAVGAAASVLAALGYTGARLALKKSSAEQAKAEFEKLAGNVDG